MKAILYLVNISFTLLLGAFILRILMQLVRANFRNPVAEIITKITNPLVLPLRKVFPPIKKFDTASFIACLIISIIMVIVIVTLRGFVAPTELLSDPLNLVWLALRNLLSLTLSLYWVLILFSILISWIQPGSHSPFTSLLHQLTEPLFAPIRRLIPPIGGLDITPIPILILLGALQQQFGFAL